MSDGLHTWIKNPATNDIPWACPNPLVDMYVEKLGWELCDEPDPDEAPAVLPPQVQHESTDPEFDPNDHSVEEVQAHLDANQDSPDETERVLDLERAGKARKSLVGDESPEK